VSGVTDDGTDGATCHAPAMVGTDAATAALEPAAAETKKEISPATNPNAPTLLDSFSKPKESVKLTFLDEKN